MAIAGLVLMVQEGKTDMVRAEAAAFPGVVEARDADGGKVACVLECSSMDLQKAMEGLNQMEGVLQLEVVYVNYEDDLDEQGHMPCPPDAGRRKHQPIVK